ncbi:GtrA family protein [Oxalobacteraceae bacterium]|nr:GtrA family protein [Oxalobacteraceae bacterium]
MARTATQFLRFAVAGIVGLLADITVLYGALFLHSGPYLGRLLSFLAAVWCTWRLNRRYAFVATASPWSEWWRYLMAMSVGALLNLGVYTVTLRLLPEALWLPALAVALGSLAGMLLNFLSAKRFVFSS